MTCHLSFASSHLSPVTCHLSYVICCGSPVTCNFFGSHNFFLEGVPKKKFGVIFIFGQSFFWRACNFFLFFRGGVIFFCGGGGFFLGVLGLLLKLLELLKAPVPVSASPPFSFLSANSLSSFSPLSSLPSSHHIFLLS